MAFRNNPQIQQGEQDGKIRRYVHAPLAIEHYGIHAKIQENGKVVISKLTDDQSNAKSDEVEYDEVEIPASLIFKLASLLKATRTVKYVAISDLKPGELAQSAEE